MVSSCLLEVLALLLLLFARPASSAVFSQTLKEWYSSDALIGDPAGLPANKRYDLTTFKCTQIFGILDKKQALTLCKTKAPFPSKWEYVKDKGIKCIWEVERECQSGSDIHLFNECLEITPKCREKKEYYVSSRSAKFLSIILRDKPAKVFGVHVRNSPSSRKLIKKDFGYGKDGFVREIGKNWQTALVIPSDPMNKIKAGSILMTDVKGVNALYICKSGYEEKKQDSEYMTSRNTYQVAIKEKGTAHQVDVSNLGKICSKVCEKCVAAHEIPREKEGSYLIPVYRNHDKKHDFGKCAQTPDFKQTRQFFLQRFGKEGMANNEKWAKNFPKAKCADLPRSAAITTKSGWMDVPPFVRASLICANKIKIPEAGKAECALNSSPGSDNKCHCNEHYISVHKEKNGFKLEKETYEEGMYCILDCVQNSERKGTSCVCKKDHIDVKHTSESELKDERNKYLPGQYCLPKLTCGDNMFENYGKGRCECLPGFIHNSKDGKARGKPEHCVSPTKCQQNSVHDGDDNKCVCRHGFINVVELDMPQSHVYQEEGQLCIATTTTSTTTTTTKLPIHIEERPKTTTTTTERPNLFEACKNLARPAYFVFVVDSSSSINWVVDAYGRIVADWYNGVSVPRTTDNWGRYVLPFVASAVNIVHGPKTKLTLLQYSTRVDNYFTTTPGWEAVHYTNFVRIMGHMDGATLTGQAVEDAYKILRSDSHSQIKVIVLISDGVPDDGLRNKHTEYAKRVRSEINQWKHNQPDVTLVAVGIGPYLRAIDNRIGIPGFQYLKSIAHQYIDATGDFSTLTERLINEAISRLCRTLQY